MNFNQIAKRVIEEESAALQNLSKLIPEDFEQIVNLILSFNGRIILTGIGKSGYIAHKIAASFSSTGTAAFYIHPAEASHGDLGMITSNDLVIMLSNSGETKELLDIINYCKRFRIKIVGVTMNRNSTLAVNSSFLLIIPQKREASMIAAPTTSALMMLSIGDALTTAVQEAKGFSNDDYKIFHPGGKIGASLIKVSDLMHVGTKLPIVSNKTSLNDTISLMTSKSFGCALVLNAQDHVLGIVTDGDLRRHIQKSIEGRNSRFAEDVMTKNFQAISPNQLASEAICIMNDNSITILPVIDDNKLVGIIHIHDLLRAGVS